MTIKDALNWGQGQLDKSGIDRLGLDAEVLLCNVLNTAVETRLIASLRNANKPFDKSFLYTYPEYKLTNRQIKKYKEYVKRRKKGEPVAYIMGEKEFYGLKFYVNKNVLIPRPETEEAIRNIQLTINKGVNWTIIDVGTGSGCIAITLAKKNPNLKIYAIDVCKKALRIAKKNAKYHGVDKNITFLQGNLLEPIIREQNNNLAIEQFSNFILIANLPYVPEESIDPDQPHTRGLKFEPKKALYAGENGLAKYRQLFEQIADLKHKPKYVVCEIGYEQLTDFKGIVRKYLPKAKIKTKKDLTGFNRVVIIQI